MQLGVGIYSSSRSSFTINVFGIWVYTALMQVPMCSTQHCTLNAPWSSTQRGFFARTSEPAGDVLNRWPRIGSAKLKRNKLQQKGAITFFWLLHIAFRAAIEDDLEFYL